MVRSMTGFGRVAGTDPLGDEIVLELRSVNSRFLDVRLHSPRDLLWMEGLIPKVLKEYVTRGRLEVTISRRRGEGRVARVGVDHGLVKAYAAALDEMADLAGETWQGGKLDLIAAQKDVLVALDEELDRDAYWEAVEAVMREAVGGLLVMREQEGEALCVDLRERLTTVERLVAEIEARQDRVLEAHRQRLAARLEELAPDVEVDEQRLAQEIVLLAERCDVTEELIRLRSHVEHIRTCLEEAEPVGRRLDFLVQEMHREANTIGSKSSDLDTGRDVVQLKGEVEKMREQVQNLE